MIQSDLIDRLKEFGGMNDNDIPLMDGALTLSAITHHGISIDRYHHHIKSMQEAVKNRFTALIDAGAKDDAFTRIAALKHVIHDQNSYTGDPDHYDDIQNADLMRVIDRRKGFPIALVIITIACGAAQNWAIDGINFPGHFLARLSFESQHVLFDPYSNFKIMEAHDLRALAKKINGPHAELSANYYDTASHRTMLLRLQNNIKTRQIENEDYQGALNTVEYMRLIAPNEYRIWFDEAVLRARIGEPKTAIRLLEDYLTRAERPQDRQDAQMIIQSLQQLLN